MQHITTIGFDLAKHVFQVHGVGVNGAILVRRQLRRGQVEAYFRALPPCLVGMEACGTARHWARTLIALGHDVRLIPPSYVKAYVRRNKTDAADAEAICEAVSRPGMRFVDVRSAEEQAMASQHRVREMLMRQRTMLLNGLRSHLAEFGIIAAKGAANGRAMLAVLDDPDDQRVPTLLKKALRSMGTALSAIEAELDRLGKQILAWHRADANSRRLETILGFGLSIGEQKGL